MIKKDFKICPVTKFIAWLILGVIVCIIGISNVFAASYDADLFTAQLYDNYGPNLSEVSTSSNSANHSGILQLVANSSGGAWGISSPTPMLANHTYALTANVYPQDCGSLVLSTYNRIGVGTTLANAKTSYQNNTNATENYSRVVGSNLIQFAFTPTINSSYIVFAFSTNQSCSSSQIFLTDVSFEDLGSSGGISESTINNSLNNQTNVLNQSITNSQNTIIQNQNENTQIINEGLNNVNEQLGTCYTNMLDMRNPTSHTANLTYSGTWIIYSGSWNNAYWDIPITKSGSYTASTDNNLYNNVNISLYYVTPQGVRTDWLGGISNGQNSVTITTSYDTGYIRVLLYDTNNTTTSADISKLRFTNTSSKVEYSQYNVSQCTSKLDETNNNLSNIFGSITNTDSATFDTSMINLIPNAPITNLLTIPISLMQSVLTRTSNSCSSISIPFLYNNTIEFPCFTLNDYLGDASYIIDMCICFVMIYNILMLFVSVFEDITSLRDEFHTLYAPKQLQLKIK